MNFTTHCESYLRIWLSLLLRSKEHFLLYIVLRFYIGLRIQEDICLHF